jgi:hypothetical protein
MIEPTGLSASEGSEAGPSPRLPKSAKVSTSFFTAARTNFEIPSGARKQVRV